MTHIENARLGRAGAVSQKAGGLFTTYDSRTSGKTQPLAGPRQERQIEHLHRLGPRVLAELLGDIATATGQHALIADRVAAFADLNPEILRFVGGDKFPPRLLCAVRLNDEAPV